MNTKTILIVVFTLGLLVLSTAPVVAGGWAVITLDALPAEAVAGETLEVGFMVRQHGVSPMADLTPSVIATRAGSSESLRVNAQAEGQTGHYVARLNLPQTGVWNWTIQAFTMEQSMPPLTVVSTAGEQGIISPPTPSPNIWVTGFGLLLGAGSSLLFVRKKTIAALIVLFSALFFTGGGFTLAANQHPNSPAIGVSSLSLQEQGEALFLAKGCITCHVHTQAAAKFKVESGFSGPNGLAPDLSDYSASPQFLRQWLANPAALKPKTDMPNLALSAEEIEALIAFLVEDSASASPDALFEVPPKDCPLTQPPEPAFIPPLPNLAKTPPGYFWYGTEDLWTMLSVDGVWGALPYFGDETGGEHYFNKLFWWNKDYDWQAEPSPEFTATGQQLDGVGLTFTTSDATNAYTPDFASAILTGVEIPAAGCWMLTGSYQGHSLSFVVWIAPGQ